MRVYLALLLALGATAHAEPDAITTPAQAIAAAEKACGPCPPKCPCTWNAKRVGDDWLVTRDQPNIAYLDVHIDKRSGVAGQCNLTVIAH